MLGTLIFNSLIFSVIGIVVLVLAFVFVDILTPRYKLLVEVVEKNNLPLAVLLGAYLIGVAIIISAAVHG